MKFQELKSFPHIFNGLKSLYYDNDSGTPIQFDELNYEVAGYSLDDVAIVEGYMQKLYEIHPILPEHFAIGGLIEKNMGYEIQDPKNPLRVVESYVIFKESGLEIPEFINEFFESFFEGENYMF